MLLGPTPVPEETKFLPGEDLEGQAEWFRSQLQPLSTLPQEQVRQLRTLVLGDVPEPLVFWVSTVEALAAGVGDRIRCAVKHQRGSLGFPTSQTGSSTVDGFLTAGHVTPGGIGSTVELETPHRFGSNTYSSLGSVVGHDDPVGLASPGGWDYALVALAQGVTAPSPLTSSIASLSAWLPNPVPVTMHAALSGVQTGGIVGALTTLGVPSPPAPPATSRLWRDCWIMIPSAIGQQGDSGAAVVETSTGAAVGMLVGGSRQVPAATYAVQYVQDLENLAASVLTPSNISII
jgi:hypothetical protein